MDQPQVWHVTRQYVATASAWTAEHWRNESARRRELRAQRKPLVTDARRAVAVARKGDPQRKDKATHKAERELAAAKRSVPDPLWLFASKSAIVAAVAGYVGLPMVPSAVWKWSAVAVSVAVVGAVVVAAVSAARKPKGLVPTAEERALLGRLAPEHWREHAEARGLGGTLTARPTLTESGITVAVRLDGTWTVAKLKAAQDNVRSLLGCRTGLRMETKAGERGGWAELILRTRSAADGDDLLWTPKRRSLGVDTVTGEDVRVPLGERLLIAGRSGAGKSVASRPLLHDASEGATNALVIIDLKRVEGRLWDHRARVASTPEEVIAVVRELVAEMHDRLDVLPKGQDTWLPTEERPRITVVVDEGAEVVTAAKDALADLETIARMGRAACIDLWWMTQKPTIGDGIPKQIAPQMGLSICLAVRTPAEARVVLGEDAQAKGWNADELPAPGVALIRDGKRKPNPVRVRYMDKAVVIGLPAREPWHGALEEVEASAPYLTLVKSPSVTPAAPVESTDDRVLDAVAAAGGAPVRQKDIVEKSGLPKGTVSKVVKRLTDAGRLVRAADGTVTLPSAGAGEVSA
jgi:S-DNA-T family DNA segregation ATPase FtsK/SpoIIIE